MWESSDTFNIEFLHCKEYIHIMFSMLLFCLLCCFIPIISGAIKPFRPKQKKGERGQLLSTSASTLQDKGKNEKDGKEGSGGNKERKRSENNVKE